MFRKLCKSKIYIEINAVISVVYACAHIAIHSITFDVIGFDEILEDNCEGDDLSKDIENHCKGDRSKILIEESEFSKSFQTDWTNLLTIIVFLVGFYVQLVSTRWWEQVRPGKWDCPCESCERLCPRSEYCPGLRTSVSTWLLA